MVPIDYRLSTEERHALYDQLNGVYMPGDSHMTVNDEAYKLAFVDTLHYQELQVYEEQEHFPLFLMGNSLQTLVRAKQNSSGHLTQMKQHKNKNLGLEMVGHPADTYLFSQMTREEKQAVFNTGNFFNKQTSGLTVSSLESDAALSRNLVPLATYSDSEFVAIAEAKKVPLYAFTYGLELVQFYFEDSTANLDNNVLDHSLIARKHA